MCNLLRRNAIKLALMKFLGKKKIEKIRVILHKPRFTERLSIGYILILRNIMSGKIDLFVMLY